MIEITNVACTCFNTISIVSVTRNGSVCFSLSTTVFYSAPCTLRLNGDIYTNILKSHSLARSLWRRGSSRIFSIYLFLFRFNLQYLLNVVKRLRGKFHKRNYVAYQAYKSQTGFWLYMAPAVNVVTVKSRHWRHGRLLVLPTVQIFRILGTW